MTGQSRFSANILLHAAKEALEGPCRCTAGAIPRRALPRLGTFSRPLTGHSGTSARSSHVGFGTWDASAKRICALGDQGGATHQRVESTVRMMDHRWTLHRSRTIAFCTARVLNSPRTLTAPRTDKLTRDERAARYGRSAAETRWCLKRSRQRFGAANIARNSDLWRIENADAGRLTSFPSGGRGSHRAKLCGLTSAGVATLP
jgi:hypothetical protein